MQIETERLLIEEAHADDRATIDGWSHCSIPIPSFIARLASA